MKSLPQVRGFRPRGLFSCAVFCVGLLALGLASGVAAPRRGGSKSPAKSAPSKAAAPAAAAQPAEFADAWPSEPRPTPPDLLLPKEGERKAEALAAFAQALVADDAADTDKALAGYRRALEFDPSYAELAVKVAYDLAKRGDVSAGIQVLKDSIKAAPKEPLPLIYLSQLYSKHLKKHDLALRYAEQALALAPDNFACYLALYELHVATGQQKKAEQIVERAEKANSTDPMHWAQLGDLYTRLYLKEDGTSAPEHLQKMNAIYRKAADLGKNHASVLAKVGDYFVLSQQVSEAIPLYVAALNAKSQPGDPPAAKVREKLAQAYLVNQQRDLAIATFEQLVKDNPLSRDTYETLGELYENAGNFEKALANFEHSLLLESDQPQNYLRVADMQLRTKRAEKAVETLRAARSRFPDVPQFSVSFAVALSQAKRHTDAMTAFAEAQAEAENHHEELLTPSFYFQYGAAAEQAGLIERAAELFERCIALDPGNAAQAYNYLGYMWVERGENLEKAGEMIKKAVEMEPDNGAYLDSLGWFYFKKGEPEKALKELLRAADNIKSEDAVVYDHIGDTYLALGRPAEALGYWQKAIALEHDNKKIADKIEAAKQKVTSAPATGAALEKAQ